MNSIDQILQEALIDIIPITQELNLINELVDNLRFLLEKKANEILVKNYNIPKPTFLQPNEWLKRTITTNIEREKELMAYKALNSMHFTFVVGWGIKGCPPSPHKRADT